MVAKRKKKDDETKQVEKMLDVDPLGMPRNQEECIKYNTTVFQRALKQIGATKVEVTYSGGGDQGQIDGVTVYKGKNTLEAIPKVTVDFYETTGSWSPTGSEAHVRKRTEHLEEALENLCDDLISATGHDGYGNDDGGGGTMTFHVKKGKVELDHYDNYVQQQSSSHSWDVTSYEQAAETVPDNE